MPFAAPWDYQHILTEAQPIHLNPGESQSTRTVGKVLCSNAMRKDARAPGVAVATDVEGFSLDPSFGVAGAFGGGKPLFGSLLDPPRPDGSCPKELLIAGIEIALSGGATAAAIGIMIAGFPAGLLFTPLAVAGADLIVFDIQTIVQANSRSCDQMDTDPLLLVHVVFPQFLPRR